MDACSSQTDSFSDEDFDFILIIISMYQLGLDEKDRIFIFGNSVHSHMTNPLLDRLGEIFNIPKLVSLIPQVPSMIWSNIILGRVDLSIIISLLE